MALVTVQLACAYVLPPSWRLFRSNNNEMRAVVRHALADRNFSVDSWNFANNRATSEWRESGPEEDRVRERYIVWWEPDVRERALTVYVRHEAQARTQKGNETTWSDTYYDGAKQQALLDVIEGELQERRDNH